MLSVGGHPTHGLPFAAAVSERGETAIATLTGDVDAWAIRDLRSTLEELRATQARRLIVDLTHASFVDSSAIGLLVATARVTTGRALVVVCPEFLERIFHAAGLVELLDLRATVADAIAR